MRRQRSLGKRSNCDGAALLMALFVLTAVLIIGVAAAHTALNAEKSARNERDRHIAFQSAEAALTDAEHDIEGGADQGSARAALFASDSALGFTPDCGLRAASANLGLCSFEPAPRPPAWQLAELDAPDGAGSAFTPYGKFTGAILPTGAGSLPARAPRYIIELMPLVRAGEDAAQRTGNLYRITAIGFGARANTQVVLQSFYRKVASDQGVVQ